MGFKYIEIMEKAPGEAVARLAERHDVSHLTDAQVQQHAKDIDAKLDKLGPDVRSRIFVQFHTSDSQVFPYARTPGVTTKSRVITDACIIEVTVQTNAPQRGDAGHGAVTSVTLKDHASTAWSVSAETPDGKKVATDDPRSVTLSFLGDREAYSLAQALEFAAQELRAAPIASKAGSSAGRYPPSRGRPRARTPLMPSPW